MADNNKLSHDRLVKLVAAEAQVPQAVTRKVLHAMSEVVSAELADGKAVGLPGLGSWKTTFCKSHFGVANGKKTVIKGHLRVRWHTAAAMKKRLNPQLFREKKKTRKK